MSLSLASPRSPWIPCLAALLVVSGCKEKYEMVTAALDSVSVSEGLSTGLETSGTESGTDGGTTMELPTTGNSSEPTTTSSPTTGNTSNPTTGSTATTTTTTTTTMGTTDVSTSWNPETTGPPATCEGEDDCTTEGSGDFGPMVLPFFRGEVCVSDTLRPDDAMALYFDPCVHPCIDPAKYGWRYIVRCSGGVGCEIGFLMYYREAVGKSCPVDAFYKFDPGLCKYAGPHKALTQPLKNLGFPEDKVLIPFVTNEDATPISMMEANAEVWKRIDGHTQDAERYFPLMVDAQNPAPPTACGPGIAGCTCKKIGF